MTYKTKQNMVIREELFNKQNGLCYYCNTPMKPLVYKKGGGRVPADSVTIEHLINPVLQSKKQLKPSEIPLVAAHAKCNHAKAREYEKQYAYFHTRKSVLGRKIGVYSLLGKIHFSMFDGYYGA